MNRNLQCLRKACDELNVEYKIHHSSENIFEVIAGEKSYMFVNWSTPLNRHCYAQLNSDKDYFYTFFKDLIKMPKTKSYFNPHSDSKYAMFLKQKSLAEIIDDIESDFDYPVIIKKNRGSWGRNVFKIEERCKLEKALLDIYNRYSSSYDYIALAQEHIDIKFEYRAVFYNGKLQFCYEKDITEAVYVGNLSPFHHEGAKAVLVTDFKLLEKIQEFCLPIFEKIDMNYCGIDIVIDTNDEMWLIETNSSPGFDNVIRFGYEDVVIELYKTILEDFIA